MLVGFCCDLNLKIDFMLCNIVCCYLLCCLMLVELLEFVVEVKYILMLVLWKYLYCYVKKYQVWGNGFGYGMVYFDNLESVVCMLFVCYYKDGVEILIDCGWDMVKGEVNFDDVGN